MIHVPPAEVSRLVLLLFVAAGVVLAITTSGDMASFGRGFAVGAGAALALSRVKRNPEPSADEAEEGEEADQLVEVHEGKRGVAP